MSEPVNPLVGLTPQQTHTANEHFLQTSVRDLSVEELRRIPMPNRVAMIDELTQGMMTFDDEATIVRLIEAEPKATIMALHSAGVLKYLLADNDVFGLWDRGRFGFLGLGFLWRDYPSSSLSDVAHWTRIGAAIQSIADPAERREVADALELYGPDKRSHHIVTSLRGGQGQALTLQAPAGGGVRTSGR